MNIEAFEGKKLKNFCKPYYKNKYNWTPKYVALLDKEPKNDKEKLSLRLVTTPEMERLAIKLGFEK